MEQTTQDPKTKILEAEVGETFDIILWEDRTAGYSWTPQYDSAALDVIDDDYVRTVNVDTADFGRRFFRFEAKQSGEHVIVMEHRIGWKFTADNRKTYRVRVQPRP